MNDIVPLIKEKRKLERELNVINNKLYNSCQHEWVEDIIENPYTEMLTKITFCGICECSKR